MVPELLKLVGDPESNTSEAHAVMAYAERQGLLLDKQQVLDMFAKADFKHEGRVGRHAAGGGAAGQVSVWAMNLWCHPCSVSAELL